MAENAREPAGDWHRFASCDYLPVHNTNAKSGGGMWLIGGTRQMVYAQRKLAPAKRVEAVQALKVLRLLASGTWTQWWLRLLGNRYTLPVQVRAATPGEAETLVRRFFPHATLEPVDTPKRPRGRPPVPREADEITARFRAGAAVRG